MKWSARPFVRIFIFLVAGILLACYVPFVKNFPMGFSFALFGVFLVVSVVIYFVRVPWQLRSISGISIGGMIIMSGILLVQKHENITNSPIPSGNGIFLAEVIKEPSRTEQSIKTVLMVTVSDDTLQEMNHPIKVIAYFYPDSIAGLLKYGDKIVFRSQLKSPSFPANPEEFDYRSFLLRNRIVAMTYISSNNWQILGHKRHFDIYSIAGKARHYLLEALEENGLKGRNQAVASAVILGYDNLMDTELEQEYVGAGAMHILCVSGLHVGIVYLALNFLLSFLKRNKWQLWLKAILLLVMVWAYALLTGLSPSVVRASLMLSLFILGAPAKQGRDAYNTLAASAVIMLFSDPMLLFNVGFQLSYSAVLGILYFYQPVYGMVFLKNGFLDKIWSVVAVSVAAQLGTFPLAAHYFHFFPTYFWITNILIFPLSFIIIGLGMFFIAVVWIPFLPKIVGLLLSWSVFLLNKSVGLVNTIPGHGIENLFFPWAKVFLVYGLVVFVFIWLNQNNIKYLLPATIMLLMLTLLETFYKYEAINRKQITVFNINKHTAVDFIWGSNHVCLMDSVLLADHRKQDYHLKNAMVSWNLKRNNQFIDAGVSHHNIGFYYDGEFGRFRQFTFVILDEDSQIYPISRRKFNIDALIFRGSKNLNLEYVRECFDFDEVILDSSVPYWKRKKIRAWADTLGIQFVDVSETNAWTKAF